MTSGDEASRHVRSRVRAYEKKNDDDEGRREERRGVGVGKVKLVPLLLLGLRSSGCTSLGCLVSE